jgi:hypothetical protein
MLLPLAFVRQTSTDWVIISRPPRSSTIVVTQLTRIRFIIQLTKFWHDHFDLSDELRLQFFTYKLEPTTYPTKGRFLKLGCDVFRGIREYPQRVFGAMGSTVSEFEGRPGLFGKRILQVPIRGVDMSNSVVIEGRGRTRLT